MNDVTAANFGLLIAFLLPGFVTLWGIGEFSPTIHSWFTGSTNQSPSVGGFLYVTLGAVATGLFVSTIRWLVIDGIHHRTGISEPEWDFSDMNENLATFELLVASHYRYYQAYSNLVVAGIILFTSLWLTNANVRAHAVRDFAGLAAIEVVLWLGSRDTLRKYYRRAEALMATNIAREDVNEPIEPEPVSTRGIRPKNLRSTRLKIEGPFR